jgi:cyclic nucleotide gated channel alpha 3
VNSKYTMAGPQLGQSISQQVFFSSSKDSLSTPCVLRPMNTHVSSATSEMDLSTKNRKKEKERLKSSAQPLLGSWSRTGTRGSTANTVDTELSTNHLTAGITCNGAER